MGGPELEKASAFLVTRCSSSEETRLALARVLEPIASQYEIVLIDCPPGEEALQRAAAGAARWILAPVKSDASSRRGFEAVADRMQLVRGERSGAAGVNPTIDLLVIVLAGVNPSATVVQREARHRIEGEGESPGPCSGRFPRRGKPHGEDDHPTSRGRPGSAPRRRSGLPGTSRATGPSPTSSQPRSPARSSGASSCTTTASSTRATEAGSRPVDHSAEGNEAWGSLAQVP